MLGDNVFLDPGASSFVLEDLSLEVGDFLVAGSLLSSSFLSSPIEVESAVVIACVDAILIRPLFQLKVVEGTTSKPFDVVLGAIPKPIFKRKIVCWWLQSDSPIRLWFKDDAQRYYTVRAGLTAGFKITRKSTFRNFNFMN
ncbi:hypothetical protein SUGI_1157400 [Cryptomeria japonica]|nr:hypothetical protein SUGI_1157400 [Cryptomeria japonica]